MVALLEVHLLLAPAALSRHVDELAMFLSKLVCLHSPYLATMPSLLPSDPNSRGDADLYQRKLSPRPVVGSIPEGGRVYD